LTPLKRFQKERSGLLVTGLSRGVNATWVASSNSNYSSTRKTFRHKKVLAIGYWGVL
jgi:hypothetical protein